MTPLLTVDHLSIAFAGAATPAVRDLSFVIKRGEAVALVGESGSGKSTVALAVMGLLDAPGMRRSGAIRLRRKNDEQVDLATLPERRMRQVRGDDVAMVFQEPMTSLDPVYRVGAQIEEALGAHRRLPQAERAAEALRLLALLWVPDPKRMLESYPHELSGGMRQRAMIAMALSCEPDLLIADEPTTALDVTIQAQIVDLLSQRRRRAGMAMLFITHDLGLVGEVADRVIVMYAGEIVESGPVEAVFREPRTPYAAGLMRSRPMLGGRRAGVRLVPIPGAPPDSSQLPSGCAFHPRCGHAVPGLCDVAPPPLEIASGRSARCWRWRDIRP